MQLPDAIERVRPSVVQICADGPGVPPGGGAVGTGFVVTDARHVVTAKHVVDEINAGQVLQIGFPGPNIDTPELAIRASFLYVQGQVIDAVAEHDLALIEIPGLEGLPPLAWGIEVDGKLVGGSRLARARLSSIPIREGVDVAVSGYPLNEPSLVTNKGIIASLFSPKARSGGGDERYLGDFTANPGNSGGPVYTTSDAQVIGVCVEGKLAPVTGGAGGAHAAGLAVIMPVQHVIAFLDRHGLAPSDSEPRAGRLAHQSHRRPKKHRNRHARVRR